MPKETKLTLREFQDRFWTEEHCRNYLAAKRWPEGFVCPKCGHKHGCLLSNGKYQCAHCHRQTSVTAGTVMHHSHVPQAKWFFAIYFMAQDKRGISATQLANLIGVTCKTAWGMLRRLRSAMGQRDRAHMLSGTVEFDDAYFGGPKAGGKRGRGTEKAKVFVALSLDKRGIPQYLKMKRYKKYQAGFRKALCPRHHCTWYNYSQQWLPQLYRWTERLSTRAQDL